MNITDENKIEEVWFSDNKIFVRTTTGNILSHPLEWFPRLFKATTEERNNYEISPFGIHWDKINEDLSLEGFYSYSLSPEVGL